MSELFSRSMQSRNDFSRLPFNAPNGRTTHVAAAAIQELSPHARDRMKKFGLTLEHLFLIACFGDYHRARYDRNVYDIPDSWFLSLIHPSLPYVRNMALVLADDGSVVTVYPKDWRFREGVLK